MNSSQTSSSSKNNQNSSSKKPQAPSSSSPHSFELTSIKKKDSQNTSNTSLASAQRPLLDLSDDQIGQPRNRLDTKRKLPEPSSQASLDETPKEKKLGVIRRLIRFLLSPEHNATFKCFCFFIYIILGFTVLGVSYYYYNSTAAEILPTFAGSLNYIGQNLNATPIQELQILPSTSSCAKGYETLELGTYQGTEKGCYCPDIPLLMQGSCNRKSGCTDYASVDTQAVTLWKARKFCVKRATSLVQKIECDAGYVQCYPGACMPTGQACPLTKDDLSTVLTSGYFDTTITTTTFKGKVLTTSSTSTTLPLFTIEYSLYATSCFDSFSEQTNATYYALVSQKPLGCGRYSADLNTFQIDSQTELALYTQNSFATSLTALPLYSSYLQYGKALLVGRNKLEINTTTEDCLDMDPLKMLALSDKTDSINSQISTSLKYGAYVHTMALISCFIAYFFMKSGLKFRKEIFQKDIFQFLYLAFALTELVIYVILFLHVTSNTILILANSDTIENLAGLQCFIDSQTVEVLQDYTDMIESIISTLSGLSSIIFISQASCVGLLVLGWVGSKIPGTNTGEEEKSEKGSDKEKDSDNEDEGEGEEDGDKSDKKQEK